MDSVHHFCCIWTKAEWLPGKYQHQVKQLSNDNFHLQLVTCPTGNLDPASGIIYAVLQALDGIGGCTLEMEEVNVEGFTHNVMVNINIFGGASFVENN